MVRTAARRSVAAAAAVLLTGAGLLGCSSGSGDTPADTVEGFFNSLRTGDYEQTCEHLSPDMRAAIADEGQDCLEMVRVLGEATNFDGTVKVDNSAISVRDTTATVPMAAVDGLNEDSYAENESLGLVLVEDRWYVAQ